MTKSDSDKIELIAQQLATVLSHMKDSRTETKEGFDSMRGSVIQIEKDISDIRAVLTEGHSPKLKKHDEKLSDHEHRIGNLEDCQ